MFLVATAHSHFLIKSLYFSLCGVSREGRIVYGLYPATVEPKVRYIPRQHSKDDRESKLGKRFAKLLLRRFKALGTKPSGALLTDADIALVNAISGTPRQTKVKVGEGKGWRRQRFFIYPSKTKAKG